MPDAAADRSRRYRERRAGRLPAIERPTCSACSSPHTGAHGLLCRRCWLRLTPDGRADLSARQALHKVRYARLLQTVTGPATSSD